MPWFTYLLSSEFKILLGIYRFQVTHFHNSSYAGIIALPGICQTHSNLRPSHTHFRRVAHSFSGHQCDSSFSGLCSNMTSIMPFLTMLVTVVNFYCLPVFPSFITRNNSVYCFFFPWNFPLPLVKCKLYKERNIFVFLVDWGLSRLMTTPNTTHGLLLVKLVTENWI